jgi:predicted metal-dependent peptidase
MKSEDFKTPDKNHIKQIIRKAKLKFFRRDCPFTMFGILAYKFKWEIENLPLSMEGGVLLDKREDSKNTCIDNTIHINENFIGQLDYEHDDLIGLLTHELLHILHRHGILGAKKSNHRMWNFACDHVVDRDCKKMGISFYNDQFNIIEELEQEIPNCTVFQAYDWLIQKVKKAKDRFSIKESTDQNGQTSYEITDNKTGQKYNVRPVPGNIKGKSDKDTNQVKEEIELVVNEARAVNNILNEKNQGSGNDFIKEYLNKLLEVEIPWEELLEKAIKTNTILKPNDRSWRKLNNYYRPHGINLPGYSLEEEKEAIGYLVVLCDISGSISKKEQKQFAYITSQSLKYFEKVILLVHNTKIIQNVEFNQDDQMEFYNFITNIGIATGGGTSHEDCYQYIQKEIWDKDNESRDKLSMVIMLTDGYSDIESEHKEKNITWNKSVSTVIVCTTDKKFEYEDRNTSTINIPKD